MRARVALALSVVLILSGVGTAASVSAWPAPSRPAPTGCHVRGALPDPNCTPGSLNPDVTQANVPFTICRKGWTATIRPSTGYINAIKRLQVNQYGLPLPLSGFEEDHLVPLENGGSPTDARNLWPMSYAGPYGAHAKDREENFERAAICSGRRTLAQAQHEMAIDWVSAYKRDILKTHP